ncbi:LOW QUALITY PROTEIN: ATP-dependent RNA helicase DHX29-like [Babylonia areolata]|uniref:LOW QUALITY PROTEIN: ATP-dependent RNA helicase DHX29-like n=1 Tax=Babylonia areolata TaxID=304850 RepID=UPI003FD34DB0
MGKRKTNKQAPLTKEGAEKQEEKAKKTYALPKAEEKGHAGDIENIEKVSIPASLEKELVDLILHEHQHRKRLGVLSKRITTKKLTDIYNSLSTAGFSQRQVEGAMSATVAMGGDLHDALDWLCLNTPNEQLPKGFSQTLQAEEEKKSKPRFDASQQVDARAGPPPTVVPAVPIKESTPKVPKAKKEDMKDWILRYAEQSSGSSGGEEEEEDPNSRYLSLTALLEDAKAEAADAKARGNKAGHATVSKKIRELTLERDAIEKHPSFNPAVKLPPATKKTAAAQKRDAEMDEIEEIIRESETPPHRKKSTTASPIPGKKKGGGKSEKKVEEEDGFNLFGFDDMQAAAAASPANNTTSPAEDVRHFEYTRQQWTGKHPKQFLIDWCRKHLPKSPPPKYHKIQVKHNRFKCRVSVEKQKDDVLSVTPDILCETAKEAEMLGCTLALYHLCRGQSVHQLLPPPYRVVWLEWLDVENSAKQQAKEKENKPRDQFVSRLMKKLKVEDGESRQKTSSPSETRKVCETACSGWGGGDGGGDNHGDDDADDGGDVQDSWEMLVDEEDSTSPPPATTATTTTKPAPPSQSKSSSSSSSSSPHVKKAAPSSPSLQQLLQRLQSGRRYQELLPQRQQLPAFASCRNVLEAVRESSVVVVAGETGSGKSTQVPQFILQDCIMKGEGSKCNIVVTQPRRISAISLASRVSEEMGESSRESRNNLCGYQVRFESRKSASTRLLYCTTGVVLRQLQMDRDLSHVSHLVIDEVHERSVQSDFLLTVVKDILSRRPDLKVILMSATLDSAKFSSYFTSCPVLTIPGRTFPVQVCHVEDVIEMTGYVVEEDSPYTLKQSQLVEEETASVEVTSKRGESTQMDLFWTKEDISSVDRTALSADSYSKRTRNAVTRLNPNKINVDLVVDLLKHLDSAPPYRDIDGAVLIFLPGLADIQELYEILTTERYFSDKDRFQIFALHSVLSSEDQNRVFAVPPQGVRKIVLATNIAETGITIPDAVFVIDSGKAKENRYNETSQMSSLTEVFISKASAKQRQGRAGRVREGFCFRLFTVEKFHKMADYTVPELLRVPLEELCLTIMKCEMGRPEDFLARCLDPPQPSNVQRAMTLLREVGACFADTGALTPLGHHLAALPVNVRVGKMLVYAAILGCLEPVAVIAAAMTDKSPFVVPLSRRDEANTAKLSLSTSASDHLTVYRAYLGWTQARSQGRGAETQFCNRYFLKRNTLLDIENVKNDLIKLIHSIGFGTSSAPHKSSAVSTASVPDVLDISQVTSKTHDLDRNTIAMVKAVLCAGLYSQVARVTPVAVAEAGARPGERKPCLAETPQGHTQIHPSSVNRYLMLHSLAWFVYGEKVKVSRVYVRDTTLISAYPLLLFGGDIKVQHLQKQLVIDSWIRYQAVAKTGVIFKELRLLFERLLERKLAEPSLNISDDRLIKLITDLLKCEKPVVKS